MYEFRQLIVKALREAADRIEVNTSEITESQAIDILRTVAHEAMTKEQACMYVRRSRSRFDDLMREGKFPRGRKEVGSKELKWYRDELDIALRKMKMAEKSK